MGLLDKLKLDIVEQEKHEKERQEQEKERILEAKEALKVAEAKEVVRANAFKKCGDTGKAAITAIGNAEEADDDVELAKESLKIAVAKRIEAIKKCVDMEVTTKEVDTEGAFVMAKVLTSEDVEAITEGMKVAATGTTKARTKGGPTKEDLVFEAIKGGNNTKKGLEAPEAGFGGDVHGQIFTLNKKGLIKSGGSGVYLVV